MSQVPLSIGIPKPARSPKWNYLWLAAGLALVVVVLVSCATGSWNTSSPDNKYEAIAQCEARIENLLKAPGTADFNTDATGGGTWTVRGTVDAENSFGAKMRNEFQCTVTIHGEYATTKVDFLND